MRLTSTERRAHPRRPLDRPCKVRLGTSGKYVSGHTRDVSAGGAMIVLERETGLAPGDPVEIGIAWNDACLIREEEMARGRVARVIARGEGAEGVAISVRAGEGAARAA